MRRIVYPKGVRGGVKKFTLKRQPNQRWHLVRNLINSLVTHERIKSTYAKVKAIEPSFAYMLKRARKFEKTGDEYHFHAANRTTL